MGLIQTTSNGEVPKDNANELVRILSSGTDLDKIALVFRANDTNASGTLGRAEVRQFVEEQAALRNQAIPPDALDGMVSAAFIAIGKEQISTAEFISTMGQQQQFLRVHQSKMTGGTNAKGYNYRKYGTKRLKEKIWFVGYFLLLAILGAYRIVLTVESSTLLGMCTHAPPHTLATNCVVSIVRLSFRSS
jgi:hypothetical protein